MDHHTSRKHGRLVAISWDGVAPTLETECKRTRTGVLPRRQSNRAWNLAGRAIVDAWWQARQACVHNENALVHCSLVVPRRGRQAEDRMMHPTWTKNGPIGPMKSWNTVFEMLLTARYSSCDSSDSSQGSGCFGCKVPFETAANGSTSQLLDSLYSLGRPQERGRSIDRKCGSQGRPNHWRLCSRC